MNVLEKILEEIKKAEEGHIVGHEVLFALGAASMGAEIDRIVRSYLEDAKDLNVPTNDGWIPVCERLPEETGYYLVTLKRKLPNEDYSDRVVALYSKDDNSFMSYNNLIKAWQPLPEPYRPEEE